MQLIALQTFTNNLNLFLIEIIGRVFIFQQRVRKKFKPLATSGITWTGGKLSFN